MIRYILLSLALLCTPFAAEAQNWKAFGSDGTLGGLKGASYCSGNAAASGFCFVIGCNPNRPVGLYLVARGATLSGLRSTTLFVDRDPIMAFRFANYAEAGNPDIYVADLSARSAPPVLSALRQGGNFILYMMDASESAIFKGSLRGSSRAIAYVRAVCREPTPSASPVPSSPPPPAATVTLPGRPVFSIAGGEATTAPSPAVAPLSAVEQFFVDNLCVATGEEIRAVLNAGRRDGQDSQRFKEWQRSPGWFETFEVAAQDPYAYRMYSGPCAENP